MRFMVIVKASPESEGGQLPTDEQLADMGKFNEELVKAGVMLAGEGLQPSSKGARVHYSGGKATVTDGPFAETKELIAGFWLLDAKSKEEVVEWMKRCKPFLNESATTGVDSHVEIRQVFELSDFPEGPGLQRHERLKEQIAGQQTK